MTRFIRFIGEKCGMDVVVGTLPIPQDDSDTHTALGTWESETWQEIITPTLADRRRATRGMRLLE